MSYSELLLTNQVIAGLGGFLIGVGLKTIIDGFVKQDDFDRRFEDHESRIDQLETELEEFDEAWEGLVDMVDRHTRWIDDIEADAGSSPRPPTPPATNE